MTLTIKIPPELVSKLKAVEEGIYKTFRIPSDLVDFKSPWANPPRSVVPPVPTPRNAPPSLQSYITTALPNPVFEKAYGHGMYYGRPIRSGSLTEIAAYCMPDIYRFSNFSQVTLRVIFEVERRWQDSQNYATPPRFDDIFMFLHTNAPVQHEVAQFFRYAATHIPDLELMLGRENLRRFCGDRITGGVYIHSDENKLKEIGTPERALVCCPPIPMENYAMMGISHQGQSYVPINQDAITGKVHFGVFDWIGDDYRSPADWLTEFFRVGYSGRMAFNVNNPNSIINKLKMWKDVDWFYAMHPRAIIKPEFLKPYFEDRIYFFEHPCLKNIEAHNMATADNPLMCASLWWEDAPRNDKEHTIYGQWKGERVVKRHGGDTEYLCALTPKGLSPEYIPGIILAIPWAAMGLDVILDPVENKHKQVLDILENAGIDVPIKLCDE